MQKNTKKREVLTKRFASGHLKHQKSLIKSKRKLI